MEQRLVNVQSDKKNSVQFGLLIFFLFSLFGIFSYFYLDRSFSEYIYAQDIHERIPGLFYISNLGKNYLVVSILFLLVLYFHFIKPSKGNEWRTLYALSCVILANIVSVICKISFGRARPMEWIDFHQYGFYGFRFQEEYWSFPSGHSLSVMSLAFALSFIKPRYSGAFILVGLVLIFTRVLLLRHYLSDVIAATLIGFIVSYVLYAFYFQSKIDTYP